MLLATMVIRRTRFRVMVVKVKKKIDYENDVIFAFYFFIKKLRVIPNKQKSHVASHVTCLHGCLTTT